MSKITRRNVLTGIAGCSMTAVFGCNKEQNESTKRAELAGGVTFTKLNVVIHGLMAMVINRTGPDKGITLVMPPFSDPNPAMSHKYLFGNLAYDIAGTASLRQMNSLGPSDICTLSGFTGSAQPPTQNSFDPNLNLIFSNVSVNCSGCRKFNLPWTTQVQSMAAIHREDSAPLMKDSCNPPTGYGNTPKLSSICVLSYDLQPSDQPKITYDGDGSDTGWNLQSCGDPNKPSYANLNIFAEPKQADSRSCSKRL